MFTPAQNAAMLAATAGADGVTVTFGNESTDGQFEEIPVETLVGDTGSHLSTEPTVVIAKGALSVIAPDMGVGRALVLSGTTSNPTPAFAGTWYVRRIESADLDGGILRVFLSRTKRA